MERLFIGKDGCIKSGWQMILLYAIMNLTPFVVVIPINICLGMMIRVGLIQEEGLMSSYFYQALTLALCNIVNMIGIIYLFKLMNKKTVQDLGLTPLKKDYKDFLRGLGLGAMSVVIVIGINIVMGNMRLQEVQLTWDLGSGLILFISVGFIEEILVRGCFQQILYERHGIGWAIFIPSLLFSAMHFLNPNISYIAALNIALVGLVFGIMTYKTGNLWMAIGYHITWNYVQGNIFNSEVSGAYYGRGLISSVRVEDNLWNGGTFGIEGGFICTFILLITFLYFGFFYKKKNHI